MSSPSECFECHWHGSRRLLVAYLIGQALALGTLLMAALPGWLVAGALLACLGHGVWALPRRILLSHPDAVTGLRHDRGDWQLYTRASGWQPVRLCRDSVAWPRLVVLRYVPQGARLGRSQCIPFDAMPADAHRRLRVRLTFSRRRWAAAE